MSAIGASYAFLPWLRRGLASRIARHDGEMTGAPRAEAAITVTLDAAGEPRDVPVPAALYGPGEVAAIDARVVIRTTPHAGEHDAEPNYFVAAELAQPDFPWRYTPARADAKGRLRPWLVLAVLKRSEIADEAPPGAERLPALTIVDAAALPRLSQSWAWAHTQIEAFDPSQESAAAVVRDGPHRVRARLLAPRRLEPNTAYRALLVPAFERGRRAGLGETLDDTIDGLAPAWADGAVNVRLPVYYQWSFQTGAKGDFEHLARRLRARAVDDALGLAPMDVRTPDPALPAAATAPLAYEGALVSTKAVSTAWAAEERGPFVGALARMLNQPTDNLESTGGEATVAPPLWARWHAAVDRLSEAAAAEPQWFHGLNADPRSRVAAGLGAEVVRRNDQQLMAAAWDQIEGLREANAELRFAQLSREASAKIHQKHFAHLPTDTFLAVTGPLHARFMASPVTVRETLARSPIPQGALDGRMRRALRPRGATAKRLRRAAAASSVSGSIAPAPAATGAAAPGRLARGSAIGRAPGGPGVVAIAPPSAGASAAPSGSLLARLNSGEVRARPPRPTPQGMVTPEKLRAAAGTSPPRRGLAGMFASAIAAFFGGERRRRLQDAAITGTATRDMIAGTAAPRTFTPAVAGLAAGGGHKPVVSPGLTPGAAAARAAAETFRTVYADLTAEITPSPGPGPVLEPADLSGVAATLLAKMDPRKTIAAGFQGRLEIADWVRWDFKEEDPLEPVMAAPEFDAPMYEPLRDYGQSWIMPGIGAIPPDTVTLVASNQRFIEAYMAGLSHEMARELLYHEYPTDQRGTYFRQFWDVRGVLGAGGAPIDPEDLRDIKRIHGWNAAQGLGANSGRAQPPPEGQLVFLIKGELLRRYPTTFVYAVKAKVGADGRVLGEEQLYPVFEGRLAPDIVFFGFNLVASDVVGSSDPAEDQGWFFVLQEQPTEPLFGLDAADEEAFAAKPASWNDLNWAHLAQDDATLAGLGYIDLNAELPDTSAVAPAVGDPPLAWHADQGLGSSGANSSDLAHITLQRPFRVAIHGSDMLPPETPP